VRPFYFDLDFNSVLPNIGTGNSERSDIRILRNGEEKTWRINTTLQWLQWSKYGFIVQFYSDIYFSSASILFCLLPHYNSQSKMFSHNKKFIGPELDSFGCFFLHPIKTLTATYIFSKRQFYPF